MIELNLHSHLQYVQILSLLPSAWADQCKTLTQCLCVVTLQRVPVAHKRYCMRWNLSFIAFARIYCYFAL